ncbi:MAG: hypothetical protein M3164_07630, partial [Actinomycetota bacterium]|nr:hypothetical protein [Actinomycetota bacterium]
VVTDDSLLVVTVEEPFEPGDPDASRIDEPELLAPAAPCVLVPALPLQSPTQLEEAPGDPERPLAPWAMLLKRESVVLSSHEGPSQEAVGETSRAAETKPGNIARHNINVLSRLLFIA